MDLSATKLRPALVIDFGVCVAIGEFISSHIRPHQPVFCLLIAEDNPKFVQTRLKVASVLRFDTIATLSWDRIEGDMEETSISLAKEGNVIMYRIFRIRQFQHVTHRAALCRNPS